MGLAPVRDALFAVTVFTVGVLLIRSGWREESFLDKSRSLLVGVACIILVATSLIVEARR